MNVLIVSDYGYISGGAAQVAIRSACALANAGVQVAFACALGPPSEELRHANIAVHCLGESNIWTVRPRWRAASQGIWNFAAAQWLERLLAGQHPPDTVVHLHQWTKAFSPSVLAAVSRSGRPFVVTLHDYFLACPNGAYFVFPQRRPCTLTPMTAACWSTACDSRSAAHKAVRMLRQLVTGAALPRHGRPLNVIHVSAHAAEVATPFLPPSTRHWTLPNPVHIEPGPRIPAERNRSIAYIGRVTVEKGCLDLAKATARAGLPLVVLGDGPALAQMRQINPLIEVQPWGDRAAVERCLAGARVLALPSLWHETGGLVVLEALARGVPAVVSTISGAAATVGDDCGLLVPPGDVEALVTALHQLSDDALVQRFSEHAHRFISAGPNRPAAHVEGLLGVYEALLADPREQAA